MTNIRETTDRLLADLFATEVMSNKEREAAFADLTARTRHLGVAQRGFFDAILNFGLKGPEFEFRCGLAGVCVSVLERHASGEEISKELLDACVDRIDKSIDDFKSIMPLMPGGSMRLLYGGMLGSLEKAQAEFAAGTATVTTTDH